MLVLEGECPMRLDKQQRCSVSQAAARCSRLALGAYTSRGRDETPRGVPSTPRYYDEKYGLVALVLPSLP